SVLEGINDEDGSKAINEQTNSLEWIAGHLNVGRYRNMLRLGLQPQTYKHLDKFINQSAPPPNAIAFNKDTLYPSLVESKEQWTAYSKIFLERLQNNDEAILKTPIPFNVPTGGNTVEDALVFVALHETYHIGQMSIIRKTLGYSSMQFAPRVKMAI
ncbi:MAG: DinB family protein, partial [Ginsengibacter sp.]